MELQSILEAIHAELSHRFGEGKAADYIPALAKVDPQKFGISVVTLDGEVTSVGDVDEPFSIQSISKVFTLTRVLDYVGGDLWKRVGREPSGSAFNSIVQLEAENGVPRNPFINAGALVVTDEYIKQLARDERTTEGVKSDLLDWISNRLGAASVTFDLEVALSEAETGFRNRSLANFLKAFGNLKCPADDVLDGYFHQCAIAMSTNQLARAGLFLANDGMDPVGNEFCIAPQRARRINALMLTCGHYDASGDFAWRVGLPGKSGVGGGILCIVPGIAAVAVWSPGLNKNGNSLLGTLALERLSAQMNWSIFT